MTTVRTNLGNTRESARQIRFEPGGLGSLRATNVQEAIEEVTTGSVLLPLTVPNVYTGSASLLTTDVEVQSNAAGAANYTVPASADWAVVNGKYALPLSIMDISGLASANNITIGFTGGETASGATTLTINTDYGGVRLQPKFGGGWILL